MRILYAAVFFSSLALAQSRPSFEVASIEPSPPGNMMELTRAGMMHWTMDDAHIDLGAAGLFELVCLAYRLPADQVIAPSWMYDLRFDVQAKLPAGSSKARVPEMMQSLLEERFHLTTHKDQKVVSVYLMTVAKGGPKFEATVAVDGAPDPPGTTSGSCNGGFRKTCRKITMEEFAQTVGSGLSGGMSGFSPPGALDRPVVDMTGLKGTYDFQLAYGRVGGGRGAVPNPDAEVVTAFDAMKALGLKLDPAKHVYGILVVDHIDKTPTEN